MHPVVGLGRPDAVLMPEGGGRADDLVVALAIAHPSGKHAGQRNLQGADPAHGDVESLVCVRLVGVRRLEFGECGLGVQRIRCVHGADCSAPLRRLTGKRATAVYTAERRSR